VPWLVLFATAETEGGWSRPSVRSGAFGVDGSMGERMLVHRGGAEGAEIVD